MSKPFRVPICLSSSWLAAAITKCAFLFAFCGELECLTLDPTPTSSRCNGTGNLWAILCRGVGVKCGVYDDACDGLEVSFVRSKISFLVLQNNEYSEEKEISPLQGRQLKRPKSKKDRNKPSIHRKLYSSQSNLPAKTHLYVQGTPETAR